MCQYLTYFSPAKSVVKNTFHTILKRATFMLNTPPRDGVSICARPALFMKKVYLLTPSGFLL